MNNQINPAAEAARENARTAEGRFGEQPKTDAGQLGLGDDRTAPEVFDETQLRALLNDPTVTDIRIVPNPDTGRCRIIAGETRPDHVLHAGDGVELSVRGNGTVNATGTAIVAAGGQVTVNASDTASVHATGTTTVNAGDDAMVQLGGHAYCRATDRARINAYGESHVQAEKRSSVAAYDQTTVNAYQHATIDVYGGNSIAACDWSTVRVHDDQTPVIGVDQSTIWADESDDVQLEDHARRYPRQE